MDLQQIKQEYKKGIHTFQRLEDEGKHILSMKIYESGIKINKYESRIKSIDSLIDKIERKDIKSSLLELNDIVGIRVVCLFLSDIPFVKEVISNNFEIIEEDNKIDGSQIDSFGYMSLHFIVRIKNEYSGPRYEGLHGMKFEIQVRTVAMDDWANISHYLDYKNENDIPDELKRDFYALSGLFYVADKHFEMFFKSREQKKEQLKDKFETQGNEFNEEINIDSLQEYLLYKFADRTHSGNKYISELIDELYESGYQCISEIDEKVEKGLNAFLIYEKENSPLSKKVGNSIMLV